MERMGAARQVAYGIFAKPEGAAALDAATKGGGPTGRAEDDIEQLL